MPSRRTEIQMTDEELRAFLAEQMVMQCATVGPRGLPHMVPLWFVSEGTPHAAPAGEPPASGLELVGWTYAKSQKARNLERDPRATIGIEDGVRYDELRGVMFECDVQIERDAGRVEGYGLRLFERYVDGGLTPEIREMVTVQARKRIGLRFVPLRVVSWDHRKLGGAY
jgi:Pyridoxamine 5'-phosphate oxidase